MATERRRRESAGRPTPWCPPSAALSIRGPLARDDLPELFERTCALLGARAIDVLRCELSSVAADAVAVDALARLALAARRHGCRVQLHGCSQELLDLVAFMGLADVLRAGG